MILVISSPAENLLQISGLPSGVIGRSAHLPNFPSIQPATPITLPDEAIIQSLVRNRLRLQDAVDITAAQTELSKVKLKLEKLLDLYLEDRVSKESLDQQSLKLETRRTELEALLASSKAPPPLLHPEMAGVYREQIIRLHEALNSELETQRQEAAEIVRSLIEAIILNRLMMACGLTYVAICLRH